MSSGLSKLSSWALLGIGVTGKAFCGEGESVGVASDDGMGAGSEVGTEIGGGANWGLV